MYKVQKNIPIPGRRTQAGKKTNFIKRLDLGDSFVVPIVVGESNPRVSWYNIAKRLDIKIAARRIDNHKLRIWIIEKDGEKLDESN